jgi:uncharacterized protein YbjT (DUF2867 family)
MIVITAPTGDIGHQVVDNLLAQDAPLRVIVRDPARLAQRVRERVEVVQGSHAEAEVVDKAFTGADAVFWLVPSDPHWPSVQQAYADFARPGAEAFKRHGVGRVVGISALGRGFTEESGLVSATHRMDDLIARTGVNYRALTMPSFMDNTLRQVQSIKNDGVFSSPMSGELKAPACATRDIAAVATRLLLDDSWSGVGTVPVLGPEDLSFNDMAAIMSDVLGRPVRFQRTPDEAFKARLLGFGMTEAMAQAMLDMAVAKDRGMDNAVPRTPEGTTPTSFREWCEQVLLPAMR